MRDDKLGKNIESNTGRWDPDEIIVRKFDKSEKKYKIESEFDVPATETKGKREIVFNSRDESKININVETWADVDSKTYMCWGDFWVKEKLVQALKDLNFNVGVYPEDADATIYLWGSPFKKRDKFPYLYNPDSYNICWFYSHPDKMTKEELNKYDVIFCASKFFLKKMLKEKWHYNIINYPLYACTDFRPPEEKMDKDIDILFVGNARGGLRYGRKAIYWLKPPKDSKVEIYGHKWYRHEEFKKWWVGTYYDYEKLPELQNRSKIVLIDGHEDMANHGFVSAKIFDAAASGAFMIAMYNKGIKDLFGDTIPLYKDAKEMNGMIEYFLKNDRERNEMVEEAKKIAFRHTYYDRAVAIMNYIDEIYNAR